MKKNMTSRPDISQDLKDCSCCVPAGIRDFFPGKLVEPYVPKHVVFDNSS